MTSSASSSIGHNHAAIPFDSGFLSVGSPDIGNKLAYSQWGFPTGKTALFLHGGPGGSTSRNNTAFFNPEHYRVILLDQRGCGASTPSAADEVRGNTTWDLVSDIETLRGHLGIEKWHVVFGGSWGSTLALAYAQEFPERVRCMVLRGVFTFRNKETEFLGTERGPAAVLYPEEWEKYVGYIAEEERKKMTLSEAYHKRLFSEDKETRLAAAKAWNRWDLSVGELAPKADGYAKLEDEEWVLVHARLECHYSVNKGWLRDGQLLEKENIEKLRKSGIHATIVQGRYDIVCPPTTAWELHKAWPESRLFWVPDAGHSAGEPGTKRKLIEVCDEYALLEG